MAEMDFIIRKAIRQGLNYLSLSPNHTNPKDGAWIVAYRTVETPNMTYVSDDDPIEAITKAIRHGEHDMKRLRAQKEAEAPYKAATEKMHRKHAANASARREAEAAVEKKRKRDMDSLI